MGQFDETRLPGIGTRVEFVTEDGRRIGVVQHHGGRREVFVRSRDDPESTEWTLRLSKADAHRLVETMGVLSVGLTDTGRAYDVEGLVFEWLDVDAGSPAVGRSIGQLRMRTRTGASIVAVLRPSGSVPAPDPAFVIEAGDTLIVAGTATGVQDARSLLETG